MCLNIGTPNNHHFPFGTKGKGVVLGVPIFKHFRVYLCVCFSEADSLPQHSSHVRLYSISYGRSMHISAPDKEEL